MKDGLRQSMSWLHTYAGLLVGWVLFMMFAAGTASYFRDEITFWMKPELHRAGLAPLPQGEVAARAVARLAQLAPGSARWSLALPTDREPGVRVSWQRVPPAAGQPEPPPPDGVSRRGRFDSAVLDPASGQVLAAARDTQGGNFFYRLHFDLHYMPALWARWIVGACAMFMLVALLTGVVTHRRILADFFTFRPRKGQRSWLDAHNAVGVLALPYHLMITYTGLVTLMLLYMPWGPQVTYRGDQRAFSAEVFPAGAGRDARASGIAAPLADLAGVMAQAHGQWGEGRVGRITISHPGDAAASIVVSRRAGHDMGSSQPTMHFSGTSGALLSVAGEALGPARETRSVLYGLHQGRFANPLLRALFFVCGLAGCAMVATGLVLWAVKARERHQRAVRRGQAAPARALRLVEGLNLAAIAGLPMAMAAFFWANRLLPLDLAARAQAEIDLFFAVWALAAVAALLRPDRRMWQVQLVVGGLLFALVPVLNALTTSTHLGVSLPAGLWRVAGFDLVCLALGLALLAAGVLLGRHGVAATVRAAGSAAGPAQGAMQGNSA